MCNVLLQCLLKKSTNHKSSHKIIVMMDLSGLCWFPLQALNQEPSSLSLHWFWTWCERKVNNKEPEKLSGCYHFCLLKRIYWSRCSRKVLNVVWVHFNSHKKMLHKKKYYLHKWRVGNAERLYRLFILSFWLKWGQLVSFKAV